MLRACVRAQNKRLVHQAAASPFRSASEAVSYHSHAAFASSVYDAQQQQRRNKQIPSSLARASPLLFAQSMRPMMPLLPSERAWLVRSFSTPSTGTNPASPTGSSPVISAAEAAANKKKIAAARRRRSKIQAQVRACRYVFVLVYRSSLTFSDL